MERDLDDTIIGAARLTRSARDEDDSDTVVRARRWGNEAGPQHASREEVEPLSVAAYGFVINAHEPIALDRPAYIGRKPSTPRVVDGQRPRLITVPSPLGEVSGTHLELRQEGTMVIATDVKSTNGTRVRLPGSEPLRLRQSESVVITPGSLIEIGDGNVIEILLLRRVHPSDPTSGATHL